MAGHKNYEHRLECVQPELGDQLWRLDDVDADPDLKLRLERHLSVCDDCRLQRAVHGRLGELAEAGEIVIDVEAEEPKRLWSHGSDRLLMSYGGLALAASLALTMLIPPTLSQMPGESRGETPESVFLRPIEGEVTADDTPRLSWRSIEGATAYRLEISQIDGDYLWQGRTTTTSLRVSSETPLPDHGHFRVLLETVPSDLSPLGGISVAFRRAHQASVLVYRARVAPLLVQLLGGLGMVSLLSSIPFMVRRRRAASRVVQPSNTRSDRHK